MRFDSGTSKTSLTVSVVILLTMVSVGLLGFLDWDISKSLPGEVIFRKNNMANSVGINTPRENTITCIDIGLGLCRQGSSILDSVTKNTVLVGKEVYLKPLVYKSGSVIVLGGNKAVKGSSVGVQGIYVKNLTTDTETTILHNPGIWAVDESEGNIVYATTNKLIWLDASSFAITATADISPAREFVPLIVDIDGKSLQSIIAFGGAQGGKYTILDRVWVDAKNNERRIFPSSTRNYQTDLTEELKLNPKSYSYTVPLVFDEQSPATHLFAYQTNVLIDESGNKEIRQSLVRINPRSRKTVAIFGQRNEQKKDLNEPKEGTAYTPVSSLYPPGIFWVDEYETKNFESDYRVTQGHAMGRGKWCITCTPYGAITLITKGEWTTSASLGIPSEYQELRAGFGRWYEGVGPSI